MTIRDMVADVQREVRDTDLLPERAAVLGAQLSALLGNITAEIREADQAFNVVLLRELQAHDKANRARIVAETSPEYARKREARDVQQVVVEMIRSLRHLGRVHSDEMRLSR